MSAPRIPKSEKYWIKKGKIGKKVIIHTHDDLDGIMSYMAVRQYLESRKFEIVGINIVNYQESWINTNFRTEYINICVDYAETHPNIDCYIDHHGRSTEGDKNNKSAHVVKNTKSAYELICNVLGMPTDELVLKVINTIDSALYDQNGVIIRKCLYDYNVLAKKLLDGEIIHSRGKERLYLAGSINQMIKRGCHTTLIEAMYNTKSPSIYALLHNFKHYHPKNHSKGIGFLEDWKWRKSIIINRTHSYREEPRVIYNSSDQFKEDYKKYNIKGYSIIGNMVFVPTGTWANGFRARALVDIDYQNGLIPKEHNIKFILMQYGGTLQLCGYNQDFLVEPTITPKGTKIEHLGKYMESLVKNFEETLYYNTLYASSGGHLGIGTISNICSRSINSDYPNLYNKKFIDLFKNKIIYDLSGAKWDVGMDWYKERDEQHEQYVNLLIKYKIISKDHFDSYMGKHIEVAVNLLRKNNVPYTDVHTAKLDKRYLPVENIKKSQTI